MKRFKTTENVWIHACKSLMKGNFVWLEPLNSKIPLMKVLVGGKESLQGNYCVQCDQLLGERLKVNI